MSIGIDPDERLCLGGKVVDMSGKFFPKVVFQCVC